MFYLDFVIFGVISIEWDGIDFVYNFIASVTRAFLAVFSVSPILAIFSILAVNTPFAPNRLTLRPTGAYRAYWANNSIPAISFWPLLPPVPLFELNILNLGLKFSLNVISLDHHFLFLLVKGV